ncbi:putative Saccharopine dehydrogenase NADP binding domain-containing protein [Seiridium cardinale]
MALLMVYGATSYTGQLASEYARSIKQNFLLADRNEDVLCALATSLDVPYRVFDPTDVRALDLCLKDIAALLNCAGTFAHTSEVMISACIRNNIYYLDVFTELCSYQIIEERYIEVRNANLIVMPGCGGSVAMLGGLTSHAVRNTENPSKIDVALYVAGSMSRGSAIRAAGSVTKKCHQRLETKLVEQDIDPTGKFDFGNGEGEIDCVQVSLPDLIILRKSTNMPDIRTFVYVAGNTFPSGNLAALLSGPTDEERRASPYHASVAITTVQSTARRAMLHTVNGYTFTSQAAVHAAQRVFSGEFNPGFHTSAEAFGDSFITSITGSTIEDAP